MARILLAIYAVPRPAGRRLAWPTRGKRAANKPAHKASPDAMKSWLVAHCHLFGLSGQNWMLLVAGGMLVYIAVLILTRQFQQRP